MKRRRRTDVWPRLYRRHPVAAVLTLLLLLAFAWYRVGIPTGTDHDRYHNKTFTCVNVVDGDTLDISAPDGKHNTTRIRLWGVDTPETAHAPQGPMYFGNEAAALTRSLSLGNSVRVVLAPERARDRYDRLLAYVYLGDTDTMLNEELLTTGHAYADDRFNHPWKNRFLNLEEKARKRGNGLWAAVTFEQMPPWRQRREQRLAERTRRDASATRPAPQTTSLP